MLTFPVSPPLSSRSADHGDVLPLRRPRRSRVVAPAPQEGEERESRLRTNAGRAVRAVQVVLFGALLVAVSLGFWTGVYLLIAEIVG